MGTYPCSPLCEGFLREQATRAGLNRAFDAIARKALQCTGEERKRWDACADEVATIMQELGIEL